MVYLDYAANCPVDEEVLDMFCEYTKKYYANPNASHKLGLEAKKIIDDATLEIANYLNVSKEEIIYTSGASEANNLAIKGIARRYKSFGKHLIISTLEHNSIIASCACLLEEGFEVDVLPVDKDGLVNIEELKKIIREDTILVSVCAVDSEIGIRQPIEEIGLLLKDYSNVHFHTDATQALGKINIDYSNVDLITITPHKFYGLNGIGILIKKKDVQLKPIINGGRSTTVYRAGTPELASIKAASLAISKAILNCEKRYNYVLEMYDDLLRFFKNCENVYINNRINSIPYTINISIKGFKSNDFVKLLENEDVIVSAKTSCCPSESPSKLVMALTKDKSLASTSIRISLSHLTTKDEIKLFKEAFLKCIKENSNE